jgi:hypothetical protein
MKQNSTWVCIGFLNGICVVYFEGGWSHSLYFSRYLFLEGNMLVPNSKGYIIYVSIYPCLLALPTKARFIVFRFIVEYSSLRDFYRPLGHRPIFDTRIFERWYFGSCRNLRLVIISWRILVSFRGFFWRLYFWMVKYLRFHNSQGEILPLMQ